MLAKRIPIPVAEAVARVMKYAHQGETEEVSLIESYGRTWKMLLQIMMSRILIALRTTGLRFEQKIRKEASSSNPIQFEVIGEIGAGVVFTEEVKAFQAVRIMTGAAIPRGCNAVVMLELTEGFEKTKRLI